MDNIKNKELEKQLDKAVAMAEAEIKKVKKDKEFLNEKILQLNVAEWQKEIKEEDLQRIEEVMPIYRKIDEPVLKELFSSFERFHFQIKYMGKNIDKRGFIYIHVKFRRGNKDLAIRYM